MSTWVVVMLKYVFAGASFSIVSPVLLVAGTVVPALSGSWAVSFIMADAIALLTLVFGLYFGNKFSPRSSDQIVDAAEARHDIRQDAAAERKDIREDAVQDRKDIRDSK